MSLIIIISRIDNYLDRVLKIKDEVIKEVKYYYLEDIIDNDDYDMFKEQVVYFLTNNYDVLKVIRKIEGICKIINGEFKKNNYNKMEIQNNLCNYNIMVPKCYSYNEISKKNIPIFCKSKKHDLMIMKIYNINTLKELFNKFDENDFYFEKEVIGKEYKVYYVNKEVYLGNNELVNVELKDLAIRISDCLNLDVYSADIIFDSINYYVIDVNPAPGFWLSSESRIALLKL